MIDITRNAMLVGALALATLGCDKDPPAAVSATTTAQGAGRAKARAGDAPPSADASAVVVDDRIAKACAVPRVHFAFDSTHVRGGDEPELEAIAKCVTDGPLAGEALTLVGHADPRGTVDYNFALGQRRAGHIAQYLVAAGVPEKRITSSSRGELDAEGVSLEGWARDRRVEVLLDD